MKASFGKTVVAALVVATFASQAFAGGHTWRVKEIFSNADGTIQYIETWEANGTKGETGTANHDITSGTNIFTIPYRTPTMAGVRNEGLACNQCLRVSGKAISFARNRI